MLYATTVDLTERFGTSEMTKLNLSANGLEATRDASAEIDSYLGVGYTLPLNVASPPEALIRVACDIARFRLYKNESTDEVKYRYEAAIKWLGQVSNGRAAIMHNGLAIPRANTAAVPASAALAGLRDGGVFNDRKLNQMTFDRENSESSW